MNVDYRELCVELFGTDDVNQLKKIAHSLQEKNPRRAGRKKKFTPEDVQKIRDMIEDGMTVNEVAKRFQTSRQVIGRYINEKPPESFTLRITYMNRQHPCTVIDVDFMNRKILIRNKTKDLLHRAFGVVENPSWEDFERFLEERCFPASRGNAKDILSELQLTSYDPIQIVEKTGGRIADDDMWLKFCYYPRKGAADGKN